MTGISTPLIEPIIAFRNRTPLLGENLGDFSYVASLVKSKDFLISLSICHNEGLHEPLIKGTVVPAKEEKLANDSMLNIMKSLPSKEIDIISFDKKLIPPKEFEKILEQWIREQTTN